MLGGIGAARGASSIQTSPTKKPVEPNQMKTIQAKNSESLSRQNSKPRFSSSVAQHSVARAYGAAKKVGSQALKVNQNLVKQA
jgi:hypothetical protein